MTVIAWDGLTMAADSGCTTPSGTANRVCKIALVEPTKDIPFIGHPPVLLFGVAGDPSAFVKVHEFLTGQTDKLDLKDKAEVLIAAPGMAWLWTKDRPIQLITGAKAAIGIGASAALGAMFVGAPAHRAVEVTCAIVDGCYDPVQAFTIGLPAGPPATEEPPELHEAQNDEPA